MESIVEFSERIASEFRPELVVLFGSYASGVPSQDSDVDLLVVMSFEGRAVDKSVEIRLKTHPPFPLDLIVRTPEAVRERLEMGDTFMQDVLKMGKRLYEAHHV